ncbi:hypothetical protein XELAEV_18004596mg [Xenopus laevis]|uniref:Uncharacterized protein n=1 Tax=Xenopus laevis TaxID=8355 RepID=A0A974BR24_XENLA|nr:hypothetical protein XELAEV_18004596mg [Xenopus laevis]
MKLYEHIPPRVPGTNLVHGACGCNLECLCCLFYGRRRNIHFYNFQCICPFKNMPFYAFHMPFLFFYRITFTSNRGKKIFVYEELLSLINASVCCYNRLQ